MIGNVGTLRTVKFTFVNEDNSSLGREICSLYPLYIAGFVV